MPLSFPFTLGRWSDQVGRKDHIIRLQASGDCITAQVCPLKPASLAGLSLSPGQSRLWWVLNVRTSLSLDSAAGEGVARSQPCGENTCVEDHLSCPFRFPRRTLWPSTHAPLSWERASHVSSNFVVSCFGSMWRYQGGGLYPGTGFNKDKGRPHLVLPSVL